VKVALHPEVIVTIKVNVARTADEAEAQSQGAVLTGPVSDRAEARAAAQALLEEELPEGEEAADEWRRPVEE
jgi:large subunit ribosomal protein L9